MATGVPPQPPAPPARNDASWPALAPLLAPAADCDCQMLAVTIADQIEAPPADIRPRIAER